MVFAMAGSKLVERIRQKSFSCLLRQEVAYFDRSENSSGAICTRLNSDAAAIQELAGTRLGLIIEIFSLSVFGFVIGCIINWELAFIGFTAFVFIAIVLYVHFQVNVWFTEKSSPIVGEAGMVSMNTLY